MRKKPFIMNVAMEWFTGETITLINGTIAGKKMTLNIGKIKETLTKTNISGYKVEYFY